MPINVTDLDSLSQTTVETREQLLVQLINELYPGLDLTKGSVLEQLLMQTNAVLDTMNQKEIENLQNSMSLLAVSENPTLADDDVVDALLSNYMRTRTSATVATGQMAIVVDTLTTTVIPVTTSFTANGRTFNPTQDYTALTNAALVNEDSERALQQRADGNYWFVINVIENVTAGETVIQGVTFTMDPEPSGYVEAYAAVDFVAGAAAGTNAELISELDEGIAAQATADRLSITKILEEQFPTLFDTSIIGYGDDEMTRDSYNIFGMSHGGMADIYVRTAPSSYTTKLSVAAYPSSAVPSGLLAGTTTLTDFIIPPTAIPAFYRILKVTPMDPTSQTTVTVSAVEPVNRGIYIPENAEHLPVINTAAEARYSAYQGNAYVRVSDVYGLTEHRTAVLDALGDDTEVVVYVSGVNTTLTKSEIEALITQGVRFYDVYVNSMPNIKDIQDFINTRSRRAPGADYLVKAAIPCFTSVAATIEYPADEVAPDSTTIKAAIASAINAVPFSAANLQASVIVDAITGVIGETGYVALPVTLTGIIYMPDGTTVTVTSQSALNIPTDTTQGVSRRTTAYLSTSERIELTLTPVTDWNV